MIKSSQTTLAKLLAKENIEVVHGNFRTAFFDVEKRILGLPLWKDRGKDVYDLLTGHEVGHALFTPPEGWHDSTSEIPGIPRSYVNVVEDVRIEKLVQRQYPGLVSSFKRGYAVLYEEDFFQVANTDLSSRNVVDRINLKAKCRDLVEIIYSAEEQPIVDQVMAVETWDDVIAACKALYTYMKDQQEQEHEQDPPQYPDFMQDDQGEDQLSGSSPSQDDSDMDDQETTEENSEETETGSRVGGSEESDAEKPREEYSEVNDDSDITRVESDEAFRNNEHKLLDVDERGLQALHSNGINRAQFKKALRPYSEVKELRESNPDFKEAMSATLDRYGDDISKDLLKFESDTKGVVSVMAKEFEMKKAAYRLQRAQTSRSGSINVNKLHSYKFNDDIFAKITNLADAKSHGMVMFVDYSGSMSRVIGKVLRQTVVLTDFCAKVNIPFVVYGFTSQNHREDAIEIAGNISCDRAGIFELLSSGLSRAEIKHAREVLIRQSFDLEHHYRSPLMCKLEDLGSTPLYETILCAEYIIKDFKAKHGVQKVNAVFLTDGDGDSIYIHEGKEDRHDNTMPTSTNRCGYSIRMNSTMVAAQNRWDLGPALLSELKKIEGVKTIGFFVCSDTYGWKSQMYRTHKTHVTSDKMQEARKSYNTNKFISVDNTLGYDKYFILNGKALSTDTEELTLDTRYQASATKAQITKAFKKHASSKKGNKVLATQFASLVA